mgnify:CR=1 FL=1
MLHTVKLTASAFQSGGVKELLDGIMVFTKQILANKEMWMMVVVLLLAMMVVYGVRTRGISHAWKTASVAGAIVAAVLQVSGCMTLDVSFQASFIFTGSCGDSSSRSDSRIFLPFCGLFKNRDITV